jgi:hypothetical protein
MPLKSTFDKLHISLNHHPAYKLKPKEKSYPRKVTDYIDLYKGRTKVYMSTP